MKRPGRFPASAGVLVLGTLGLAAVGCGKPKDVPPGEPSTATRTACSERAEGIPVTVFVELQNGEAVTANKYVALCQDKDWVEWVSCDGDFEDPTFSNGSPFGQNDKPEKKPKKLKSPKAKNLGKFDYTMKLVVNGTSYDVDPRIEVMK